MNFSDELNYTFFDNDNCSTPSDLTERGECVELVQWFLLASRGPQRQPLEIALPLTIINVAIFVTGLLGNVAVCLVIIRHPSMHTATNYYLFNLAVSDLTLLIFGLPNDVALYWHQYPWLLGETFCKVRALFSEMASYVSVLTIVSFSTERYLSICYPLYLYTMSGLQRAVRIIACLWVISFFSALPFALYSSVDYLNFPPDTDNLLEESAFCAMFSQPESVPLNELSTFIFFILPMLVMAVQYTKMGMKISKSTRQPLGKSVHRDSKKSQSHRTIIKMLAAVVIAFFISWAPFHAQRLLYYYGRDSPHFPEINAYMFFITGILYYFSSTVNPILYNVMSNRYRTAFKDILCGRKKNSMKLSRRSTYRDTKISQCEALRMERDSLSRAPSQKESGLCNTLVTINGKGDKCLIVTSATNGSAGGDIRQDKLVSKVSFKTKRDARNSETYI
ncbi:GPRGHP2 [Trypoxylus dichotomus]